MDREHLLLRDYLTKKAIEIKGADKRERELRSLKKASYTSFYKNAKLTKMCLYHSDIKNSSICFLVFNAIMDYMNEWHDRKHIRYRPVDIRKRFSIRRSSWDKARKLLLDNNMIEFYETDGGTCIKIPLPSEWYNLNDKQKKLIRKEISRDSVEDSLIINSDSPGMISEIVDSSKLQKKVMNAKVKDKKNQPIILESGKPSDLDQDLDNEQLLKDLDKLEAQDECKLNPKQKALKKRGLLVNI